MPNDVELNSRSLFTPDVLDCIADLSNDEVFTPPKLVNQVLDLLPPEIWHDKNATFLDPACKSGVWLRGITKRLINGLADEIPDLQERIDHILHQQIFGIAITELTSLLSRRSLYCSKYPNGKYSISHFDDVSGDIWFKNLSHQWKNGKCELCGASQAEYDRSEGKNNYAYGFIHCRPEYWEEVFGVKFDVIIGNPPYQLSDGGGTGSSATPIYQKFVEAAKALDPRYLCMIIPARWFTGGKGLDDFRKRMTRDNKISHLVDYVDSKECFSGVDIKGGVCYFLRDKYHTGATHIITHKSNGAITESEHSLNIPGVDIFVRDSELVEILRCVMPKCDKGCMSNIVSPRKPYGLAADFIGKEPKYGLPKVSDLPCNGGFELLGLKNGKRVSKYLPQDYPIPKTEWMKYYKVFVSKAYGNGNIGEVAPDPISANPRQICTETFIQIGKFRTEGEVLNCIKYMKTKFFRVLVSIKKQTQNTSRDTYSLVPLQDFSSTSDIPWEDSLGAIDACLYKKYDLSDEFIAYIESSTREVEL